MDAATDTAPGMAIIGAATPDVFLAEVPVAPMVPLVSYVSPGGEGETGARVIGLPALSADGVTLLTTVSWQSPDASDRLVVQLRSARTGAVQRTLVIVGPAEAQALFRGLFTPAIDARLRAQTATANAVLGRLRARTIPGVEARDVAFEDGGPSEVATGAGWFVAIIDERLVVRRGDARGPVALRVRVPRMEGAESRCLVIPRPIMRGFFVVAPDRLLVQVDYLGNRSCEGGPDNWMLVAPD